MKLIYSFLLTGVTLKLAVSEFNLNGLKALVNLQVADFDQNTSDVIINGRVANYDDEKCLTQLEYLQAQLQDREIWAMKS